jgi:hypothetical protein
VPGLLASLANPDLPTITLTVDYPVAPWPGRPGEAAVGGDEYAVLLPAGLDLLHRAGRARSVAQALADPGQVGLFYALAKWSSIQYNSTTEKSSKTCQ